MALPAEKDRYTFADYLTWDESVRYELVDGVPVALASPSDVHQAIVAELTRQLGNFLEGKKCRLYPAPFDVRLFERDEDTPDDVDTVFQPDLMVVCDRSKVDKRGIHGAPDLIIEVVSPSTARHDRLVKMNHYQRAGVREYWIVSPEERTAQVFLLNGSTLRPHEVYTQGDIGKVNVLDGCFIELEKVFRE